MAIDLTSLWDFSDPQLSEQRFREALASASPDDALILQTQIARSYGLRQEFARAREILASVEREVRKAGAEARIRHALEIGRTLSSATHAPESQTAEVKEAARTAYVSAFELARAAGRDGLAIDALHMLAFVDTDPADQLKWGNEALAIAEASAQEDAKRWEASLRNNVGYALHELGRFEEALEQFEVALALRERAGHPEPIRIARWMVAWTLRCLGRTDEALRIQLQLEREREEAGAPGRFVFQELETLYRLRGEDERGDAYAAKLAALDAAAG